MKHLKLIWFFISIVYLGFNIFTVALIRYVVLKPEFFMSTVDLYTLALGVIFVLIDKLASKYIVVGQMLLALGALCFGRTDLSVALFCTVLLITSKLLVVVFYLRSKKVTQTGQIAQANPHSGKTFYRSSAWRRLRYRVLAEDGKSCVSCGESRVRDKAGRKIVYHVDHKKPRSLYPHLALSRENLQVMCECCNIGKGNLWEIDHTIPNPN